jgi:RES domain-containing protein
MANNLCSECILDEHLKKILEQEGEPEYCDACQMPRPLTVSIERLGELLEPIIRKHFAQGEDVRRFSEDDRDDYWEQEGDGLDHVVQEVLGQYLDFDDEIVQAVVDAEDCNPRDGDIPFFDKTANYIETPPEGDYTLYSRWIDVKDLLIKSRRFFSSSARDLFDDLFLDIDEVLSGASATKDDRGVVLVLAQGFLLYRSRTCFEKELRKEMLSDPFAQIGPPPASKAVAGRMNAQGIPVFYGATDQETCLAELRPALGGEAAIIAVETTRPLRVLDFTRMETAYKALSYFQTDFEYQASKLDFLRALGHRISRPIIPGKEERYLITQMMSEYLAHVHPKPFDGILFPSAQRAGGINVVLFLARGKDRSSPPFKYVRDSLKFFETVAISYEHRQRHYDPAGGGQILEFFEE